MDAINRALFALINASPSPNPEIVALARVIAVWGIYGVVAATIGLWIRGSNAVRRAVAVAWAGTVVAMALNFVVGLIWFSPRPFAIGAGTQFLEHAADNSFPSDHVTLMLALGVGLLLARGVRLWGLLVTGLGIATAWARIYLGVHWPFDMLASVLISGIGALIGAGVGCRVRSRKAAVRLRRHAGR